MLPSKGRARVGGQQAGWAEAGTVAAVPDTCPHARSADPLCRHPIGWCCFSRHLLPPPPRHQPRRRCPCWSRYGVAGPDIRRECHPVGRRVQLDVHQQHFRVRPGAGPAPLGCWTSRARHWRCASPLILLLAVTILWASLPSWCSLPPLFQCAQPGAGLYRELWIDLQGPTHPGPHLLLCPLCVQVVVREPAGVGPDGASGQPIERDCVVGASVHVRLGATRGLCLRPLKQLACSAVPPVLQRVAMACTRAAGARVWEPACRGRGHSSAGKLRWGRCARVICVCS